MNKRNFIGAALLFSCLPLWAQARSRLTPPCPKGSFFGSPSAANRVRVVSSTGQWEVRFDSALLVLENDSFKLVLPRIGMYEWVIASEGEGFNPAVKSYAVGLFGSWGLEDCPPVSRDVFKSPHSGILTFTTPPTAGTEENCSFTFRVSGSAQSGHGIFGDIKQATAVSTEDRMPPKIEGRFQGLVGETLEANAGVIIFTPSASILEIKLEHNSNAGGAGTTFHVQDFTGSPGIYLRESSESIDGRTIRVMMVYQITEFSKKRVAGRSLWAPLEAAKKPGVAPEDLLKIAKPLTSFETSDLVTLRYPEPIRI